ncbi:MAG: hypothetical protein MK085_01930 [Phycisphaerales bacterium]|nr:hypothetical protein [Phycisphaerales bacterium]
MPARFTINRFSEISPTLFLGAVLLSGCGPEPASNTGLDGTSREATSSLMADGDEVIVDSRGRQYEQRFQASTRQASAAGGDAGGRWSIVLATTTGDAHDVQAQAIYRDMRSEFSLLQSAFVRSNDRGSTIWFGRFQAANDPELQAAREQLSGLQRNGQPVFRGLIASVLPDERPIGPSDLRRARLMHPNIDPLYTLQVACWGTFGANAISWSEVRTRAEAYAAELRRRGYEAWYHHDAVSELSVVTVGVFDHRAYDSRSTLFSPEVEQLRREFPQHMINGEKAMLEMRPGDETSRVPQTCRLVSVPELP